jgi:hypothetical protein
MVRQEGLDIAVAYVKNSASIHMEELRNNRTSPRITNSPVHDLNQV